MSRARAFYEIFGWEITLSCVPGIEYWLAHTGDDAVGIDGAIMPRTDNTQPVINWISVEDLDAIDQVPAG